MKPGSQPSPLWWLGNVWRVRTFWLCALIAVIGLLITPLVVSTTSTRALLMPVVLSLAPLSMWYAINLPAIFGRFAQLRDSESLGLVPQLSAHLLRAYASVLALGAGIALPFCALDATALPLSLTLLFVSLFGIMGWSKARIDADSMDAKRRWGVVIPLLPIALFNVMLQFLDGPLAIQLSGIVAGFLLLGLIWKLQQPYRQRTRPIRALLKGIGKGALINELLIAIFFILYFARTDVQRIPSTALIVTVLAWGTMGLTMFSRQQCLELSAELARQWLVGHSRSELLTFAARRLAAPLPRRFGILILLLALACTRGWFTGQQFFLLLLTFACLLVAGFIGNFVALVHRSIAQRHRHIEKLTGFLYATPFLICLIFAWVVKPSPAMLLVALSLIATLLACGSAMYLRRAWSRIEL